MPTLLPSLSGKFACIHCSQRQAVVLAFEVDDGVWSWAFGNIAQIRSAINGR
jgi:hypothetical protein